jgi:hypothetical protein
MTLFGDSTPTHPQSTASPGDAGGKRPKLTHIFDQEPDKWYVEPHWLSARLFDVERFPGPILDPFAGWGRCVTAARNAGYKTIAFDIIDRSADRGAEPGFALDAVRDFLTVDRLDPDVSVVSNPPFTDKIAQHVIRLNPIKVALIWPLARVVAAWPWLADSPLARAWMLTPRPAIPTGHYLAGGEKPGGARPDHCWLVFERGYSGPIELCWLRRDCGGAS